MEPIHTSSAPKRAIRIGGASGGFTDRQRSILSLARDNDVDVIIGDWMSEMTIQWHGAEKAGRAQFKSPGASSPITTFDPSFMGIFTPALPYLQQRRIKVAVNAGASEPDKLAGLVIAAIKEQNLDLKVAWIQGGEVMDVVGRLMEQGEKFENICLVVLVSQRRFAMAPTL